MLTGSLVAIATPMSAGGALDLAALRALIDWHVAEGTSGIVIVGTTGESPTVDHDEHRLLIRTAVEHAAGRVPVIAGTGANATREAIDLTEYAKGVGADSCLSVVPYYNKPTQEGMYRHFRAIAEVGLPVILYNVPGRTVADLANETVLRLADVPGIVGLKDATADLGRCSELLRGLAAKGKRDFAVYSGEDITALPLMLVGGHGVISVTANVAPRLMSEMCKAALAGDLARARECNDRLLPLHRKLFVEANPIPVKFALAAMGRIANEVRLPLVPLSPQYHEVVRAALRDAGALA
jgi:4-hydroxy-tetrahydrodipicolinate synthase